MRKIKIKIHREHAMEVFQRYVKNYNDNDMKIRLKIEHTYRVAALCEQIGESLGMVGEERNFAWLLGLLHDIGRFEQLKNYGTFNDDESIDHAKYGSEILFGQGLIRDFVAESDEDELIQQAVYWHSAYRIPEDLDETTAMYCHLLRDADKIDILKVTCEFPLEEIYNVSTEEIKNAAVTPEVLESFYEEHAILRRIKRTVVDNIVGHISLVFELVYIKSIELVVQQGDLNKLLSFESLNKATMDDFCKIRKKMEEYVNKRMTI